MNSRQSLSLNPNKLRKKWLAVYRRHYLSYSVTISFKTKIAYKYNVPILKAVSGMDKPDKIIPHDDIFTVNYSDSMEIRNILRSKLVEAQGRETDKIPMFVSWPGWLDDGIVCLYVNDLREILRNAVRETAHAMLGTLDNPSTIDTGSTDTAPSSQGKKKNEQTGFTPLAPADLTTARETPTPASSPLKQDSPRKEAVKTGGKPAQPDNAGKPSPSTSKKPRTLGNMLDQDDIEQLIRDEMNRKKR